MSLALDTFPKISIVTPSYNQGRYLERTILSVINQNYPNLEYIIIDGGSTDDSVEIIKKHEHYLHYWISEPDKGHYDAVNKGFAKASGEILAWLNSDDMYCPWALQTVASVFSSLEEVEWLTSLYPLVWDKEGFCLEAGKIPGFDRRAFMSGINLPWDGSWSVQQESTFWRRSLWEKVGGLDIEYTLAGDFDLWARFYALSDLYGITTSLGGFRVHDEQRSHQVLKYREEAKRSLQVARQVTDYKENLFKPRSVESESLNRLARLRVAAVRKLRAKTFSGFQIERDLGKSGNKWVVKKQPFYY